MKRLLPRLVPLLLALAATLLAPAGLTAWAQSVPAGAASSSSTPAPSARPPAPAGATPAGETALETARYTLPNGLTVIVRPDRRAPTAVVMVWVRVGSMDEVDGTSGVAHVLEHMLFKGTKTMGPGEYSRRIAILGGSDNAFTARDVTSYYQQIPVRSLEEVLRLEADRFAHNQWSDDEFRRELEVVKEERRLRTEDSPRARLFEALNAAAFVASPYRRPIIGWMSDLDAMTPQDARDFFQRWYIPANAAVVVAGDVSPAQVLQVVERHFGGIPARAVPVRKPREEPPQAGIRRIEVKAPAEQSFLTMQYRAPRLTSLEPTPENDDALALTLLAGVLEGHAGARLDRALTQGPGRLADSVGASNGLLGRGPQMFTLTAVPAPGKSAELVEAALRAEIVRVAREGVSEAELQRVKTGWTASEIYKLDSLFAQARELGTYWSLGMPLDAGERLINRLRAVTAAQVQSVAARYFSDDQLTLGVLKPLPPDPNRRPRAPAAAGRH